MRTPMETIVERIRETATEKVAYRRDALTEPYRTQTDMNEAPAELLQFPITTR